RTPQPTPERGQPLGVGQEAPLRVAGVGHGPQLAEPEFAVGQANAALPEEGWFPQAKTDKQNQTNEQRPQQHEASGGQRPIEREFAPGSIHSLVPPYAASRAGGAHAAACDSRNFTRRG